MAEKIYIGCVRVSGTESAVHFHKNKPPERVVVPEA